MAQEFKIKPIHGDAIPEALRLAEHYRLLNEPLQAESICRDILRVDPDHEQATITIILSLTDQFKNAHHSSRVTSAREYAAKLDDAFKRAYYSGLIAERQARALLRRGMAGAFAYDAFREAMGCYEKAETLRPPGNDDAILRWNSCVRTVRREDLRPREDEQELLLE